MSSMKPIQENVEEENGKYTFQNLGDGAILLAG